jgi:hypothetical protein
MRVVRELALYVGLAMLAMKLRLATESQEPGVHKATKKDVKAKSHAVLTFDLIPVLVHMNNKYAFPSTHLPSLKRSRSSYRGLPYSLPMPPNSGHLT